MWSVSFVLHVWAYLSFVEAIIELVCPTNKSIICRVMNTLQNSSGELAFRDGPFSPGENFMIFEERLRTDCLGASFSHYVFLSFPCQPPLIFNFFLDSAGYSSDSDPSVFESSGSDYGWNSSTSMWSSSPPLSDWNWFSSLTSHSLSTSSNILRILACSES